MLLALCSWSSLLAMLLGKDLNWDLLNYHVYNPHALLTGRHHLDIVPAQLQTFLNPLMDIPLYLALLTLPPVAVGALYGFVQGLNGLAAWLIAREVLPMNPGPGRSTAALGLAFLGGLGAINISELGGGMGDTLASIPGLFSIALLIHSRAALEAAPPRAAATRALLAGALSGVGAALKLTSAIYCAGFAVGCLFLVRDRRLLVSIGFGLGAIASWLGLSGFWLWDLWSRFGNPLFPYFNGLFRSEFGPLTSMRDERFLPASPVSAALYPLIWAVNPGAVSELSFRDWRFGLLYVLLVALGARWCVRRWRADRWQGPRPGGATPFLLVGSLTSYGLWLGMFGIYRYLALLEWLVPLGLALVLSRLCPARGRALAIAAALVLVAATTKPMTWGRGAWIGSYFGVVPPRLAHPDASMVLMAGDEALGFLVPHFAPAIRFVRIQSNFHGHGPPSNGLERLVERTVGAHAGDLYVVYGGTDPRGAVDAALKRLRLRRDSAACERVRTTPRLPRITLCPVSRLPLTDAAGRDASGQPRRSDASGGNEGGDT